MARRLLVWTAYVLFLLALAEAAARFVLRFVLRYGRTGPSAHALEAPDRARGPGSRRWPLPASRY